MIKFKVGDRIIVTKGQHGFFPSGAKGTLTNIDEDGDWWADLDNILFPNSEFDQDRNFCLQKGYSEFKLLEDEN